MKITYRLEDDRWNYFLAGVLSVEAVLILFDAAEPMDVFIGSIMLLFAAFIMVVKIEHDADEDTDEG